MELFKGRLVAIIILLTLEGVWCHGERITLNLQIEGDRRRFIVEKHRYKDLEYQTIRPFPGYIIDTIFFYTTPIFKKIEGLEAISIIFIYYNEFYHNIPIFVVKSDAEPFMVNFRDLSPHEYENKACVETLFYYVKRVVPSVKIQERLRDISEDPPKITLNKVIYRVFNGEKYMGGNQNIVYGPMITEEELLSRNQKKPPKKRKRREYEEDEPPGASGGPPGGASGGGAEPMVH